MDIDTGMRLLLRTAAERFLRRACSVVACEAFLRERKRKEKRR